MKRGGLLALALGMSLVAFLVAALIADPFRAIEAPLDVAPPRVLRIAPMPRDLEAPTPLPLPIDDPETLAFQEEFGERTAALAQQCGIATSVACASEVCVAITEMPDLDFIGGWFEIARTHRRFVTSTWLSNQGVPSGLLPCASAVNGINSGLGAVQVERPDGNEVWCAVDAAGGGGRRGWIEEGRTLCDQAAAAYGLGIDGFTDSDARILKLPKSTSGTD